MTTPQLLAHEARFRRAGLPLLIEGREADTDVWNRAFPLLTFVFLVEVFGAKRIMWSSNYPAHPRFGRVKSRVEESKTLTTSSRSTARRRSRRWRRAGWSPS